METRNIAVWVLSCSALRISGLLLAIVSVGFACWATSESSVVRERCQRAAADGFRQDPFCYYFAGLANTVGAVLAIDGKSGESWLFLPSNPPFARLGLQPEAIISSKRSCRTQFCASLPPKKWRSIDGRTPSLANHGDPRLHGRERFQSKANRLTCMRSRLHTRTGWGRAMCPSFS